MAKAKDVEEEIRSEEFDVSQWEFIDKIPTPDDVKNLLMTLNPWWGLAPVWFADYVQGLPSSKKVMVTQQLGDGRTRKVEQRREVITLYFSVAGRMQMLRQAQEVNRWLVDLEPEPVTPTGVPGFLRFDDEKLVYREYCTIWMPVPSDDELPWGGVAQDGEEKKRVGGVDYVRLGRRPGTAWVPASGGRQAAGSNPYEKVETSARGRALGAWGFGVLPGSGIASLEEMLGAPANREALEAQHAADGPVIGRGDGGARETAAELREQVLTTMTEIQQITGRSDAETAAIAAKWFKEKTGVDIATSWDTETGDADAVDLEKVTKEAQLVLARNAFKLSLTNLKAQQEGV